MPFPFSDLSGAKLRPAIVVAHADRGDVILCQVTSRSYSSRLAIGFDDGDLADGSLQRASFARPDKLFTAAGDLAVRRVARLQASRLGELRRQIVSLFT